MFQFLTRHPMGRFLLVWFVVGVAGLAIGNCIGGSAGATAIRGSRCFIVGAIVGVIGVYLNAAFNITSGQGALDGCEWVVLLALILSGVILPRIDRPFFDSSYTPPYHLTRQEVSDINKLRHLLMKQSRTAKDNQRLLELREQFGCVGPNEDLWGGHPELGHDAVFEGDDDPTKGQ